MPSLLRARKTCVCPCPPSLVSQSGAKGPLSIPRRLLSLPNPHNYLILQIADLTHENNPIPCLPCTLVLPPFRRGGDGRLPADQSRIFRRSARRGSPPAPR